MQSIKKLDKMIITLQKKICSLPICTPNVATQLPHNLGQLSPIHHSTWDSMDDCKYSPNTSYPTTVTPITK
jgi:hypothetical protein